MLIFFIIVIYVCYVGEFDTSTYGIIMYSAVALTGILGVTIGMLLHKITPQHVFNYIMKGVLIACSTSLFVSAFLHRK